jgi:hypothetical protein
MLPTPLMLDETRVRVYFASTDASTIGRIGFLELDAREPLEVLRLTNEPVLDIGRPGTFDDNGVNPCCVVRTDDAVRLYYVGYQLQRRVPYTLFTGCAVSTDGGETFGRMSEVPVLDRCEGEELFRTAAFVERDDVGWRAWYIGGSDFSEAAGRSQPVYSLRVISSKDGVTFRGPGRELLAPRLPGEIGFGRPFITRAGDRYEMHYSVRSPYGYGLGYAQSSDAIAWDRLDDALELVGPVGDWESEMTCYAAIVNTRAGKLMLYNGNGYGRTGFGVARAEG